MKPPAHIGNYPIVGRLASGGMAEILLAKRTGPMGFERPVVIKRVLPHLADEEEFRNMFLDEARIVAALHHPNIVGVQELGQEDGELYLVMEYLGGENLSTLIKALTARAEHLDPALSAHIIAEACAGLHAAHELVDPDGHALQIVHRDVSPQNVFITYEGTVKVLDFGIAKARERYTRTRTGQLKGKFAYMAPEQCRNVEIDRRADLWALGAVLYELGTGHRAFGRPNELSTIMAITEEPIVSPTVAVPNYPKSLEAVVLKALARDADLRYQTAAEMRDDLLDVVRLLAPRRDLQGEAARTMKSLFGDQIYEKKEMLRQASDTEPPRSSGTFSREGHALSLDSLSTELLRLPKPPPLPSDFLVLQEFCTDPDLNTKVDAAPLRRSLLLALLGVAAVAGSMFGVAHVLRGEAPEPESPPAVAEAPAPASTPSMAATATAPLASAPAPSLVHIRIDSEPNGALVHWDGILRGATPLEMVLGRDDEVHTVELTHQGHLPLRQEVVPDVDQRLRLVLQATPEVAPEPEPEAPSRAVVRRRGRRPASGVERVSDAPRGFYAFD